MVKYIFPIIYIVIFVILIYYVFRICYIYNLQKIQKRIKSSFVINFSVATILLNKVIDTLKLSTSKYDEELERDENIFEDKYAKLATAISNVVQESVACNIADTELTKLKEVQVSLKEIYDRYCVAINCLNDNISSFSGKIIAFILRIRRIK